MPFVKKPAAPAAFDGVGLLHSRVHREPENVNERELGADAAQGLDAVHVGRSSVHQDDVRPELVRPGDRLASIGGFARDLAAQAALPVTPGWSSATRVDRRRSGSSAPMMQGPRGSMETPRRAGHWPGPGARSGGTVVPRPAALSMSNRPPSRRQTLADAEQPPSDLAGLRPFVELRRVESESLVRHGDAERVIRAERQNRRRPGRPGRA